LKDCKFGIAVSWIIHEIATNQRIAKVKAVVQQQALLPTGLA
jgi:hypothetical protein